MSSTVNSPKLSNIPIVYGSKFSPSIEKSSQQQQHRSTFHLSNIFHTLTKFSRNIRTTNSFIRSTSTNTNEKLTRRSFTKIDKLSSTINRPSSCFILFSPSKHEKETCLFFQKSLNNNISPKLNSISSFNKIKRVSSFLLPLKRKQSLSLNHSLHEKSFKAKESTKHRSRLINYSIFKHQNPIIIRNSSLQFGIFGYKIKKSSFKFIEKIHIFIDIIQIDLILQIRLNTFLYNNYQLILYHIPNWSFIQLIKPFYGIILEKQILILFQPKLFNNIFHQKAIYHDFIYIPFHQIKYKENNSIYIGYDSLAPTTIRIPLTWISKNHFNDYQISSKDI